MLHWQGGTFARWAEWPEMTGKVSLHAYVYNQSSVSQQLLSRWVQHS